MTICPNCGKDGIEWQFEVEYDENGEKFEIEYGQCKYCGYPI